MLWRTRGVVPRSLRLLYLKDAEACDYTPDAEELARFERTLVALWRAIDTATTSATSGPKPSRLCGWCSHQSRCPAYGGTPPPFPEPAPGGQRRAAVPDGSQHHGRLSSSLGDEARLAVHDDLRSRPGYASLTW